MKRYHKMRSITWCKLPFITIKPRSNSLITGPCKQTGEPGAAAADGYSVLTVDPCSMLFALTGFAFFRQRIVLVARKTTLDLQYSQGGL